MAENDEVPASPDGGVHQEQPAPEPVLKTRWRDRAWSFKAMATVAAASLLLGGIAGGTVVAVADDDRDDRRFRMGPFDQDGYRIPPGMMRRGPRDFDDDVPPWRDGPRWRWDDDTDDSDDDGTTPQTPAPSASPESTG